MPVEQQLTQIFEVIEGGAQTTAEIIQFPSDAGATALEGVTETVELGNGVATEVSQLTVVEGGATTTAGVGLLAMDVGAVGLAIAPFLGIAVGAGLYALAPEFWTNVSNSLVEAGQTIGGKVRTFLKGDDKTIGVSEETLNIFKQAFVDAGVFIPPVPTAQSYEPTIPHTLHFTWSYPLVTCSGSEFISIRNYFDTPYMSTVTVTGAEYIIGSIDTNGLNYTISALAKTTAPTITENFRDTTKTLAGNLYTVTIDGITYYERIISRAFISNNYPVNIPLINTNYTNILNDSYNDLVYLLYYNSDLVTGESILPLQDGATYPTGDSISTTYPDLIPWTLPSTLPTIYPIEIPANNPNPTQQESQNPDTLPSTQSILDFLIDNLPVPDPLPEPTPEPVPTPDPDPQPEPDPIPEPDPTPTDPDPVDPNPDPTPSPTPIVPDIPDSVPANAMFTVYKPTQAQINAFGGWLWSSSIMEAIKRIWQNPLDGIISFMKVYVDPTTSSTDTIKVGMLDSEVSAGVVSGQFVTVECGELDIAEKFYNATDYSPFTSLHLYLPFIGIVELDIDEFMSGKIKVTYHVDVYTGTCLAEVKTKRSPDMPNYTIVYSFSGNASQQLPLTSAEFGGAISSLVSAVGGGLAIASGGGLGLLAGASGMAHAVTHEMVHLAHSGSMSANAGIMGARKPFLIITRHKPYDANGYNQIYGYPSNKTVYLNNCSGFVRVKEIQLSTGATTEENNEIISLLKGGVII